MSPYDRIKLAVDQLIAEYRDKQKDGLTVNEIAGIAWRGFQGLVSVVEEIAPGDTTPEQFGDIVATAYGEFFDKVIKPLDIPGVNNVVEAWIVDPTIRAATTPLVKVAAAHLFQLLRPDTVPLVYGAPTSAREVLATSRVP